MSERPEPQKTKKRVRRLSPLEQREQMAAAGDVEGLWAFICRADWGLHDLPQAFKLLLKAIEVAGQKDPERFSRDIFAHMVALPAYLIFRTHYYIGTLLSQYDRVTQSNGPPSLSTELMEKFVPRLVELQTHVAALAESQARTARLWELTRRKRQKNQRGEATNHDGRSVPSRAGSAGKGAHHGTPQHVAEEILDETAPQQSEPGIPLAPDPHEARTECPLPETPRVHFLQNGQGPTGVGGPFLRQ